MARPVRTSNLLKETAADHENLDRMADQERLAVNRAATQPPVQENESVIEKAEEKEPSVQEKLDAILPDDFFGEFEDLFNSEDVHIKEQIKQDMSPDILLKAPATVTDDGAAQAVSEAAEEKADEEEIAQAVNENTAEKTGKEISVEDGVERISSNDLSKRMNVTASQIRQDLNNFGGFGQQGYGYNVKFLYEEIGKILGLNQKHNIIVIGAGNLGQALANYVKFEKLGFVITALFDVNPALEGVTVRGIKIHMLDELEDYCKDHVVDIAALTMPKEKADAIANRLVNLGIQAIWNFAHVDLDLIDKDVVVENVHLSDSLMQLSYNIVKNKQNK